MRSTRRRLISVMKSAYRMGPGKPQQLPGLVGGGDRTPRRSRHLYDLSDELRVGRGELSRPDVANVFETGADVAAQLDRTFRDPGVGSSDPRRAPRCPLGKLRREPL